MVQFASFDFPLETLLNLVFQKYLRKKVKMNNSAEIDSFDFGSYCSPRENEEDTPKAPAILSDIVRSYIDEEASKNEATEETKRAQKSSSPQKRMSMGSRAQACRGKRQSN